MKKNYYELTYIINPVLDEADIKNTVAKFTNFLKDNGATIELVDEWGIRRLAYEIDKKNSGYYVNAYFEGSGDVIVKLERALQIDESVFRYMTLKYDSKMLRHRELQKKGAVPSIFKVEEEAEEASK